MKSLQEWGLFVLPGMTEAGFVQEQFNC